MKRRNASPNIKTRDQASKRKSKRQNANLNFKSQEQSSFLTDTLRSIAQAGLENDNLHVNLIATLSKLTFNKSDHEV